MKLRLIIFFLFLNIAAWSQQNLPGANKASAFETTYQSLKLYPNPVISNAVLEFRTVQTSQIQVALLNIVGAQVKTLVNESRVSGLHSFRFEADQLQRGTYFVRLSVNGEIIKTIRVAVSPQ